MSEIKQKRIKILLELFGEQIKQRIKTENLNISEKELLNKFVDYEITESGKYLEWMVKCYINNGFLYEDLYKVKETLEIFNDNKMKLSKDQRDIQQYKTLAELWIEVKKFVEQKDDFLSTNEQKRKEKELAYQETEFLYEDDNLRLVAPLTETASKWWGKGTRWCTAAENNNMFMTYFQDSPLLIFDFKDGEKWQLWMYKHEIQFMDEDDKEIKKEKIEKKWKSIENIFLKLLKMNGYLIFHYIPDLFKIEKLYEFAIQQNGLIIQSIKVDLTENLYKLAVQQNGIALHYVPEKFRTQELYKLAVGQNGLALQYIQEELMTEELCKIAANTNGISIHYIPENFRNREIYELAVKSNGKAIIFISKEFCDIDLYKLAIENNGHLLYTIPEELITLELCEIAVRKNGTALYYVSQKYRTEKLCKLAVEQAGLALEFVPLKFRTKELCKMAVEKNGLALKFVPEKFKTKELCEIAIKENFLSLYDVPEKFKTPDFYETARKNFVINNNLEQYKEMFSKLKPKDEFVNC